jgi:hypothetical protein
MLGAWKSIMPNGERASGLVRLLSMAGFLLVALFVRPFGLVVSCSAIGQQACMHIAW